MKRVVEGLDTQFMTILAYFIGVCLVILAFFGGIALLRMTTVNEMQVCVQKGGSWTYTLAKVDANNNAHYSDKCDLGGK